MSDKMMFPENIDDFLSGFAFKDSEEIYTNGSMLIPLFRVQQAFEHYSTEIRNKAIDDFKRIICEELKLYIDHEDYMCVGLSLHKFTKDLAEQLKEGGV